MEALKTAAIDRSSDPIAAAQSPRPDAGQTAPSPRMTAALALLLEAHDHAQDLHCSPWEFAVELPLLRKLRLTNNDNGKNRSRAFQFDAVRVQLGHTLTGLASLQCGSDKPFDLSTIPFPILTGDKPAIVAVSWCQV